jgi:hypothetical protein
MNAQPRPSRSLAENFVILQNLGFDMERETGHMIFFLERNTFNVTFRKPAFEHEWIEFDETGRTN